ncbi:MAG: type II toxin-antitoxin system RelE/ParE family toxin, partial [Gammaproteobacteria bacterium]|nr:type II toxin-antitoxin system RelE/ParE family toxin [Gammaproteobacteria bacterium]
MRLLVTPTFDRAVKKLHRQQKSALDEAVRTIVSQPEAGEPKVGDLSGVQVYKFRMVSLLCLLAYRMLDENT